MNKLNKALVGSAAFAFSLVAGSAHAVLPAEATTALTEVATFGTDMISAAWPIVALITVGLVGIGLFKKFVSKAT
jgi:hypothetical protein